MRRINPLAVSSERLAEILAGAAAATRAKRSAAGRKGAAARIAKQKARQRKHHAAAPRHYGARIHDRRPRYALAGFRVMAARMDAGAWYTVQELYALAPDFPRRSVRAWTYAKLLRGELVEKAHNPDFDATRHAGNQSAARFVFRLTARGATLARGWRKALGG